MKSESLNGILTFILGVLVVLGVIFALKVVFVTRDARTLQTTAMTYSARLAETQAIFNDAQAYNQKYPSAELTSILDMVKAKPAAKH